MILWLGSTIHSALSVSQPMQPTTENPWAGWRGVVYVCMRPRKEFTNEQIAELDRCLEQNLGTNHWATRVVQPNQRFDRELDKYSTIIQRYIQDPRLMYDVLEYSPEPRCYLRPAQRATDEIPHATSGGDADGGSLPLGKRKGRKSIWVKKEKDRSTHESSLRNLFCEYY